MYIRKVFATTLVFAAVNLPILASAQIPTIVPCDGVGSNPCTICHLGQLAQNLLNGAIFLSVFLCALLFAYAGWLKLSNEAIGKQQQANELFKDVVIGFIIILGAWLFVDTLMKVLMGGDYLPWNRICPNR